VADSTSSGPGLNLYMKSMVERILEKGNNFDDTRAALQDSFKTIRSQQGSLTGLCNYLRSRNDLAMAKPLLAMTLAANEQYEAAAEVLEELVKESPGRSLGVRRAGTSHAIDRCPEDMEPARWWRRS
jgi:hypothetical protein